MNKAIEKAIEGGWEFPINDNIPWDGWKLKNQHVLVWRELPRSPNSPHLTIPKLRQSIQIGTILLDPLFWQALGKAMGGEEHRCVIDTSPEMCGKCWSSHWHRFIDHLAEGKDAEEFFTNLLK